MVRKLLKFLLIIAILGSAFADYLINSKNWEFVFVASQDLAYSGRSFRYVVSEKQMGILPYFINSGEEVYEDDAPVIGNLAAYIRNTFGKEVYTRKYRDFMELQRNLATSGRFYCYFVVSRNEPENALIALEAARASGCITFIAHRGMGDYIKLSKVTLIGRIPAEIIQELKNSGNTIEIIDKGSPYENAKEVINRYFPDATSAYLSTGDFLEPTFFTGRPKPFILIGKGSYPRDLITFLKEKGIKTVYIIGTELLYVGRLIRDDSNKTIGVFVKFGEGYTNVPGYSGRVLALSVYRINIPRPELRILNATYDPVASTLYITVENAGDGQAYVLGYIDIKDAEGELVASIYDKEPVFVEPRANISIPYGPLDLETYAGKKLFAYITMKYGRYADFLTNYITEKGELPPVVMSITFGRVGEFSKCIELVDVRKTGEKTLRLSIKNNCNGDLYLTGYVEIEISGKISKLPFPHPERAKAKSTLNVVLNSDEKITQDVGDKIKVVLKIGETPAALSSFVLFEARLEAGGLQTGIVVVIIAVVLVLIFFAKRSKKRKHARVKTERLKRSRRKVRL